MKDSELATPATPERQTTSLPHIVGIMLVRNEDRFIRQAVTNVLGFCDRLLIADNGSTDDTWEIAQDLAGAHAKVESSRIRDPRESSEMIAGFANTNTWVFGVDGDEIYDPAGLARLRTELQQGAYDRWWVVFGNVCNCTELDLDARRARGYLAPPCRSMTKLYNFSLLDQLDPDETQRLHGRNHRFRAGFDASLRHEMYKMISWDDAWFRCLHVCFVSRSSRDQGQETRSNITEGLNHWKRFAKFARRMLGLSTSSSYKREKYMRGPLATVDATPFFP